MSRPQALPALLPHELRQLLSVRGLRVAAPGWDFCSITFALDLVRRNQVFTTSLLLSSLWHSAVGLMLVPSSPSWASPRGPALAEEGAGSWFGARGCSHTVPECGDQPCVTNRATCSCHAPHPIPETCQQPPGNRTYNFIEEIKLQLREGVGATPGQRCGQGHLHHPWGTRGSWGPVWMVGPGAS